LFITHYQALAGVARGFEQGKELRNVHMRFTATRASDSRRTSDVEEEKEADGDEEITFLYEVGEGVAHRSYGLNVARLAHVPKPVIEKAALKSREMEMEVKQKKLVGLSRIMADVLSEESGADEKLEQLIVGIDEL
jgi:DNA mismatch repair protein MSH3